MMLHSTSGMWMSLITPPVHFLCCFLVLAFNVWVIFPSLCHGFFALDGDVVNVPVI